MGTDLYQHVRHLAGTGELAEYATSSGYELIGIDNLPGSIPLESTALPPRALLLFGQEGTGLTDEARAAAHAVCSIAQYGSTCSMNAGVAAGIAMHAWIRRHGTVLASTQDGDSWD